MTKILVSPESVAVEHPDRMTINMKWDDIEEINLVNSDQGPFLDDVWLQLKSKADTIFLAQGKQGYDEVYDIVSQYQGFNFDNVIESMTCTGNETFLLWETQK
ncbi:MAG: hypothetical protein M3R25_14855 [Bacteroidota bacterium]|nr:hypothetical protein [Bacteroidota bacterium]